MAGGQRQAIALVAAQEGDALCAFEGEPATRNRYTVQMGESLHLLVFPQELRFINHSCDPNVIFDADRRILRALRAIAPGEELVYFYPATEWSMAEPFDCHCATSRCLKHIQGAKHLPPDVLATYELAPHIEKLLRA
jgi:hypothetical protein